MASKTDGVASSIYRPHNSGGKFFNNPTNNEVAMIERIHMRRLREMCINRFEWKGLPDSVDQRFLESLLFDQALAVYCRPEQFNPIMADTTLPPLKNDMVLRATPSGYLDYQDNPMQYTVLANHMFSATLDQTECVPIWANTARMPDHDIVMWYARRLAEAERTTDINIKNARHPRIIAVPEEQRMTGVNFNRKVDEGEPVIFTTDTMNMAAFTALNVGMDHTVISTVQVAKNQIMNDCMTMLGINNANQDKKERLVADEVDARSEQVGANRAILLGERQRAAERINKMFNMNISVTWAEEVEKEIEKEGEENGNVHDGTEGSSETNE